MEKEYETKYGKIRYIDYQKSQKSNIGTIVYIHGLGCCGSNDYYEISKSHHLSDYRHIIVDLLGSGLSDKPLDFEYSLQNQAKLLENFIADIKLENVILYGHSMGGTIAILLAKNLHEKIKLIILSEANLDNGGGIFSREIANCSLEKFCNHKYHSIVKNNFENGNGKWANSLSNTLHKAVYEEAVSLVKGQKESWRKIFYNLPFKKIFIFGENSLPDEDFNILREQGINVKIVNNAGHSMAWENPKGLVKVLYDGIKNNLA